MTSFLDTPTSPWLPAGREDSLDVELWHRIAAFERTGASVAELAYEMLQSILGYDPKDRTDVLRDIDVQDTPGTVDTPQSGTTHVPPRADIQKYKDVYQLFTQGEGHVRTVEDQAKNPGNSLFDTISPENQARNKASREKWNAEYALTPEEQRYVGVWKELGRQGESPEAAFTSVCHLVDIEMGNSEPTDANDLGQHLKLRSQYVPTQEAKKYLGQLLKKEEQRHWGQLYQAIKSGLDKLFMEHPDSYKLWPWAVKQMKADFEKNLSHGMISEPGRGATGFSHIVDVVGEGGSVLSQLRAENKLPQNMDVNKMDFGDFADWLMEWKRENRQSLAAGEVVYSFHDGSTIQKLTTPEQLQYEGDEMGHCVGGYSGRVEHGGTIIYSLRDKKNVPHVTMEVEAIRGEPDQMGEHEYYQPDKHEPKEVDPNRSEDDETEGNDTFEIVQIQGKANNTPKPEYQSKIKEFLDSLRAKGWKFVRSHNWYGNYDDPDDDSEGEGIRNAMQLDDWYTDRYQPHHNRYRVGGEDAYGMAGNRLEPYIPDWENLLHECALSLSQEYDRSRWHTGNWKGMAQAVYHAWMLLDNRTRTREQHEHNQRDFERMRQAMEEEVQGWEDDNWDSYMSTSDYHNDMYKAFEKIAEEHGVWDEISEEAEQITSEQGSYGNEDFAQEVMEIAQDKHEDLWYDAESVVRDEYNDGMYDDFHKFDQYLYMLIEHHGSVNPADLPDPNQANGGLKSFESLGWAQDRANQPTEEIPGTFSSWHRAVAHPVEIHPIDEAHNVWFDEDGEQHPRFRPSWQQPKQGDKQTQDGPPWDTFLDNKGRQAQGWVAYNDDVPVGSLTYVDQGDKHMLGTAYVHPDYREQGLFNRLVEPLRGTGKPIDAYVWNNPWLQEKVRSWQR